jgi:hypothetical protein
MKSGTRSPFCDIDVRPRTGIHIAPAPLHGRAPVVRLQLRRVDEPEASRRCHEESGQRVTGERHLGHGRDRSWRVNHFKNEPIAAHSRLTQTDAPDIALLDVGCKSGAVWWQSRGAMSYPQKRS